MEIVKVDGAVKKYLSNDEMLDAKDIEFAEVEAFGGLVRVGSIEAGQMIEFVEANKGPAKRNAGMRLIIQSLVDAEGNRIGDMKDLDRWKRRSQKTCNNIVKAVLELNGLNETTIKKKRDNIVAGVMAAVKADTLTRASLIALLNTELEIEIDDDLEGNA